jgi:hypothetical protein
VLDPNELFSLGGDAIVSVAMLAGFSRLPKKKLERAIVSYFRYLRMG